MSFRKTVIIIVLIIGLVMLFLWGKTSDGGIISPQVESQNLEMQTPVPTSIPTPIVIDQISSLEEETQSLTPEDFSKDYTLLKEEAGKL